MHRSSLAFSKRLVDALKFNRRIQISPHLTCGQVIRKFHLSSCFSAEGIALKMPSLSPTMMEGKIVKWLKQEGDPIQPGDVICDIETDKAVVSMEVDEEGTLAKILVDETKGTISIGTLIAVLAPEGEDWKTIEIPDIVEEPSPAADAASSAAAPSGGAKQAVATPARLYGPAVKLLLEDYGLNDTSVKGTGPHGALLKGDVLQYIKQAGLSKQPQQAPSAPSSAPSASAPLPPTQGLPAYTDVEVTGMRRTIASRLLKSKSGIAHSYGTLECKVDELNALRQQLKREGARVSVNDLIIKAVSVALQACPAVNSVWYGDQVAISPTVDISVAVATPTGLITPIVTDVANKGLKDISATVRELASRAKINKLKPEEFQGGSFTISNLGMFGIKEFTAIINPPQCAILAVGASREVPGPNGASETRMRATLSYDRLAIEDHMAAEFLSTLAQVIENPRDYLNSGISATSSAIQAEHPLAALL